MQSYGLFFAFAQKDSYDAFVDAVSDRDHDKRGNYTMKFPGGLNIQAMMKQAQQMQEKMAQEMEELRVEASAGGGVVTVAMKGNHEIISLKNEPEIVLWGDGSPTREFLYVEDAAEAIVLASERYDGGDPINLGTGREISILELAQTISAEVGFRGAIRWDATKPNGQPRRCLDVTRAERHFGFRARCGLREGIERTVTWFKAHRNSCQEIVDHDAYR